MRDLELGGNPTVTFTPVSLYDFEVDPPKHTGKGLVVQWWEQGVYPNKLRCPVERVRDFISLCKAWLETEGPCPSLALGSGAEGALLMVYPTTWLIVPSNGEEDDGRRVILFQWDTRQRRRSRVFIEPDVRRILDFCESYLPEMTA